MLSYIVRWLVFALFCALLLLSIPAKYGHAARDGADAAPPTHAVAPVAVAASGAAPRSAVIARAGARPWRTLLSPWRTAPHIQTI